MIILSQMSYFLCWTLIARVALTQLNKAGFCESLEAPVQRTMVVICNFRPKIMMPILIKNWYNSNQRANKNHSLVANGKTYYLVKFLCLRFRFSWWFEVKKQIIILGYYLNITTIVLQPATPRPPGEVLQSAGS